MNNTQKINYLLDSKKTFKNFVEGNSNKLALITSHSIAENLGKSTHNPSLIYGPSGCGKTTLLNIIGGLDRYTSGDLIIKDKSTKEYKDRDCR